MTLSLDKVVQIWYLVTARSSNSTRPNRIACSMLLPVITAAMEATIALVSIFVRVRVS